MPTTRKETEGAINMNQLKTDMDILIKRINANNEFNIAIITKETKPPWFEISIEYPRYSDGKPNFQRRISMREVDTIVWNIFYNIRDYHGYEYKNPNFEWVKPREEGQQYSNEQQREYIQRSPDTDDIPLHKKIHVRMLFAE